MTQTVIPVLNSPPLQSEFEDLAVGSGKPTGYFNRTWVNWFDDLWAWVKDARILLTQKHLLTQNASIASTPLQVGTVAKGWYAVTVYARATQAATTSGSVVVTIEHRDDGIAAHQDSPALTNDVAKPLSYTFLVKMDASSPLTFATTYASVGATPLVYKLDLFVERLVKA